MIQQCRKFPCGFGRLTCPVHNTSSYQFLCIEIFAQASISILTQVHNSYLYLLKKKNNISKKLANLTKTKMKKLQRSIVAYHSVVSMKNGQQAIWNKGISRNMQNFYIISLWSFENFTWNKNETNLGTVRVKNVINIVSNNFKYLNTAFLQWKAFYT